MKKITVLASLVMLAIAGMSRGEEFRFAILADRTGGANQEAFLKVVQDIARLRPDFVVTVGDMIEGYNDPQPLAQQWDSCLANLKAIDCPIYFTPGNHDIFDSASARAFTQKTGRNPYYAFDRGRTHFIVLNNAACESYEQMDPAQMQWLRQNLEMNRTAENIIVAMHKPFNIGLMQAGREDPVHQLFRRYPVRAVFAGHWHTDLYEELDGIAYMVVGSSGGIIDSRENIGLGSFYQFLWCPVRDSTIVPSIVKAGSTYPADLVRGADQEMAERIATRLVTARAAVAEGPASKTLDVDVAIINATGEHIDRVLAWTLDKNWTTNPPWMKIVIAPGDTFRHVFTFSRKGAFYPLPVMSFDYPFGPGKEYYYRASPAVSRSVSAPRPPRLPGIDGRIDPLEWAKAAVIRDFCGGDEGPCGTDPVTAYLMADEEYLYVAARCAEPQMDKLKDASTQADQPVYNDDCVGMLLSADSSAVHQFYVNSRAVIWDQRISLPGAQLAPSWNGDFAAGSFRGDDYWTVELRIPLASIGATKDTKELRANIRRKQQRNNQSAFWVNDWSYNTGKYGTIKLPK